MIRTGHDHIHNISTGKTYHRRLSYNTNILYVYCDGARVSERDTTQAVWDYLLSLVHTDLTKQAEEVTN